MTPPPPPPGWFPDPLGRHEHRYFNGTTWTADVADGGQRFVDPLGIAPGSAPGGAVAGRPAPAGQPFHYPAPPARNGIATAAMVCGLIALVTAWVPLLFVVGLVLAVLALVFGVKGLRRSRSTGTGRGFAITGLATGTAGIALAVVGLVLTVIVVRAVDDFIEPGPVVAGATACTVTDGDALVEGELTNRSRRERDYTVFVDVGDAPVEVVPLDDVAPGETVTWRVVARVGGGFECDPERDVDVTVQGPFPFGIEIDPVG